MCAGDHVPATSEVSRPRRKPNPSDDAARGETARPLSQVRIPARPARRSSPGTGGYPGRPHGQPSGLVARVENLGDAAEANRRWRRLGSRFPSTENREPGDALLLASGHGSKHKPARVQRPTFVRCHRIAPASSPRTSSCPLRVLMGPLSKQPVDFRDATAACCGARQESGSSGSDVRSRVGLFVGLFCQPASGFRRFVAVAVFSPKPAESPVTTEVCCNPAMPEEGLEPPTRGL